MVNALDHLEKEVRSFGHDAAKVNLVYLFNNFIKKTRINTYLSIVFSHPYSFQNCKVDGIHHISQNIRLMIFIIFMEIDLLESFMIQF